MNESSSSRSYRSLLLLLLAVTVACSSALGIDDAHLDPTFNAKASDQKTLSPAKGGVCKAFDNQARLANLLPDGGLMPLPSH